MRRCAAILSSLIALSGVAAGDTYYVATNGLSQWPYTNWTMAATSIVDAVESSATGDTILVSSGTYRVREQITVTNGITIRSVHGAAETVIDGCQTTRCFWVDHPGAVVSGFTIQNGRSDGDGGGLWCGTSTVVENCIFRDNATSTNGDGGGVYCYAGLVHDCIFRDNATSTNGDGGGVYCYAGLVHDCTFSGNTSADDGGGIQLELNGVAERCWFADNTAADKGGAAVCRYGGTLRNCVMVGNQALCAVGDPVGVGLSGGAVYGRTGIINIENCTIVSNTSPGWVGGMSFLAGTINIRNTIAYDNPGGNYDSVPTPSFSYCCTTPMPSGTGNISGLPAFADQADRNFHLSLNSPCLDAGESQGITNDINNVVRPLDGNHDGTNAVDIGAYEFVNPQADSDQDGQLDQNEVIAGTGLLDPTSFFHALGIGASAEQIVLTWSTVYGKAYTVQACTNLLTRMWTNAVQFSVTETNDQPEGTETLSIPVGQSQNEMFYRVLVER